MNSNGGCVGSDRISTHTLKKGPWTAAEDAILMEYVKKHGEGNWNAVHKNSRLMRCGKSCRLRWTNHLRPNLKKGSFSPLEEKIILQLHAKLGNKWARMAAQLPGRTDNEIKNYWNTRMKRRQRAGLPIHPRQVGDKIAGFLLQLQKIQQCQGRKPPSSSSLSSKFLSTSQGKKHDSMNSSSSGQNQAIPSFYSNLYTSSCCSNNSGFALPLSSPSQLFASPSSNLYKRNINVPLPAPSFQLQCGSSEHGLSFCSLALLMGSQTEPIDLVPELKVDLVSSQTPPQRISTPTSYTNTSSGGVYMVASSGNITNNYFEPMGSSGLLDAILVESRALFCNERNKDGEEFPQVTDKGKAIMDAANVEEEEEEEEGEDAGNNNKCFVEKRWDDFSSSPQSSMGVKPRDESIEEMNSMDDNLLSLLNNIPSSMPLPLPEWYIKIARMPNGSPPVGTTDGNMVFDAEQNDSAAPAATTNLDRALGSRCWKNMPGIC